MAEPIEIKITNIQQIRAAYSKAPALMMSSLSRAIRTAAFLILGRSMQNTPVLTGRLRASHGVTFQPLSATVGPNTVYDVFVHEGTRFMAARPFLRTAVERSQPEVDDLFTKAVQDVLNTIGNNS